MKKILIANPKGGSGKSTIATNLAGWFAKNGKRAMLGDTDRQQSSRAWLSVRSPSLPTIAAWDIQPGQPARPPKNTTHVILDTPAGLRGKRLTQLLKIVDQVIVPIQPSLFDIFATNRFLDELLATKQCRKETIRVAVVGMRVDPRTRASGELERYVQQTGLPIVAHLHDAQVYVQAAAHGMSIFDLSETQAAREQQQWQPLLCWIDS